MVAPTLPVGATNFLSVWISDQRAVSATASSETQSSQPVSRVCVWRTRKGAASADPTHATKIGGKRIQSSRICWSHRMRVDDHMRKTLDSFRQEHVVFIGSRVDLDQTTSLGMVRT